MATRTTVILVEYIGNDEEKARIIMSPQIWGSLKDWCEVVGISIEERGYTYNNLSRKKFPFETPQFRFSKYEIMNKDNYK